MRIEIDPTDILVAPPSLDDERFSESVILLINHKEKLGSIGLCVNRPLFVTLEDVIEDKRISEEFLEEGIFWGGPVQEETLWILHSSDWEIDNTIEINDEWSISSHEDMFAELTPSNRPTVMRLFMGYCSWEPGQLLAEITGTPPFEKRDSWLTINSKSPEEVLSAELEDMWQEACEIACAQAVDKVF